MRLRRLVVLAPLVVLFTLTTVAAADSHLGAMGNLTLIGPSSNVEFGGVATIAWPTSAQGPMFGLGVSYLRLDSRDFKTTFDYDDYRPNALLWPPMPVSGKLPAENEWSVAVTMALPLRTIFGGGK